MDDPFAISQLGACRYESPLAAEVEESAEGQGVLFDARVPPGRSRPVSDAVLEAAGPRRRLYFDPPETRAAIVTCGGLCPGLNDVIRAVTMVLWYRYGVRDILGLRYGYAGLTEADGHVPIRLTPEVVEDIHQKGGTMLGTSRGPQNVGDMVDFLQSRAIDILFTVGGDGTQRGALAVCEALRERELPIAVVGIPKTIDNDLSYTERTFGFETAVALSQVPIAGAHMEAKGVENGVGLVKLMGRESGFVAAYATLASSDVNLLLVPEVPFSLDRVLSFLEERLARKAHAVIVVAEGAGQNLVPGEGKDASGNPKLGDIGPFLKERIASHFRGAGRKISVKYIDPSYTIRSAPASADDSVYCFQLGLNAVHAAMSGRTGMVVGYWNGHHVHVPMAKAVEKRKRIDPAGSLWTSVLDNTGQPDVSA